jgi:dephospho-CoA kinase
VKTIANIGITGGIGSGKSFVCEMLAQKGIRIYYADVRAKNLLENDPNLVAQVKYLLGEKSYFENGLANRSYIASQVFSNQDTLNKLNAIIHPATIQDFEQWKQLVPREYPWNFQCKEAAILFESGTDKGLDAVVCVSAPEEIRIQRVEQRDGLTRQQILDRMQKQLPESERIARSQYILNNDGIEDIATQVNQLISQLQTRFGS